MVNKLSNSHTYKSYDQAHTVVYSGLKPSTTYSLYHGGVNVSDKCVIVRKSGNYDLVFDYYFKNDKSNNKDVRGTNLSWDSSWISKEILFNGYNNTGVSSKASDVITVGSIGDPLISDENGFLAFTYYSKNDSLEYSESFSASKKSGRRNRLKIDNLSSDNRKELVLKNYDGTSIVRSFSHKKISNSCDIDNKNKRSSFSDNKRDPIVGNDAILSNVVGSNSAQSFASSSVSSYNCVQTFLVDPSSVQNSTSALITSVEIYIKSKPAYNNSSGISKPGINVYLVPTSDRIPVILDNLSSYPSARREYDYINASSDATVATKFLFNTPVLLTTGKEYGIVVKFDGQAPYQLWKNTIGELIVGTNRNTSAPTGKYIGNFFNYTTFTDTQSSWVPLNDVDLKFKVNVARYAVDGVPLTANSKIVLNNKSFEFATFNVLTSSEQFRGGETVYQLNANLTGNVSVSNTSTTITGTSTLFNSLYTGGAEPEYIVVMNSASEREIRKVISVTSNTVLTVDRPFNFSNTTSKFTKTPVAKLFSFKNSYLDGGKSRSIILKDSTSNSTMKFANNLPLYGEISGSYVSTPVFYDWKVSSYKSEVQINTPGSVNLDINETFNYSLDSSGNITTANPYSRKINPFIRYSTKDTESPVVPSRTNEIDVIGGSVLSTSKSNSSILTITPTLVNDFAGPLVNEFMVDTFIYRWVINNDYTDENTKYGNAHSKHITTKVNVQSDSGAPAEDLIVYLTAKRAVNTDIKVFAKIYNKEDPEAYDDKDWTLLAEMPASIGLFTDINSKTDTELSYTLPQSPNTAFTANGAVTTTLDSYAITGSGTNFSTELANNDLVKVYSSLFPQNYIIATVNAVTSNTALTLSSPINNASIVGTGFKIDKIDFTQQAFSNKNNSNVSRYYNSSMVEFDRFNTFSLKIVLLSDSEYKIPSVKDIRAVAVSA